MAMGLLVGLSACGSPQRMSPDEVAKWIAAYTPEQIDLGSVIEVEATDSLLAMIDTLRPLKRVFRFSPSIRGEARYEEQGRCIRFYPKPGALKQGTLYTCHLSLARLTEVDTLRDLAFEFMVSQRECKFSELSLAIDPNHLGQVVVSGEIGFSTPPSEHSLLGEELFSSNVAIGEVEITPTEDPFRHRFTLRGIPRQEKDSKLRLRYNPQEEFSIATAEVLIPGMEVFKLISVERYDAAEPYIEMEFSLPLSMEQELEGLISIDQIDKVRIERRGTNVKLYYPRNGLQEMVLRLSELLKSVEGSALNETLEYHFEQEQIAPAIEIPISGTILPDGNNLALPFRAVNLAAVDVEVVKVYTENIMSYLQECNLDYTNELRRVGRLIYRQTVRLDQDPGLDLHRWQNFSIDLKQLFREERGAIYNIRLSFRRAYSLYGKSEAEPFALQSGVTAQDEELWDKEYAYIHRSAPDMDWEEYDWEECDDPSKASYYMCSSRMPEYNLVASNLGLIVKRAEGEQLWCAVSDIMTAAPKQGVLVTAYNYQLQPIGSAYSNAEGFADFKLKGKPIIITATDGLSTTYLKLKEGYELSTSRFPVSGKRVKQGIKGFVYGERGVWRPGDDIHLTLMVEDKQHALPKNHPVTMELYSPQGQLFEQQTLTQSVDGIYAFTTRTPSDAPTGQWEARFKVGGESFHHPVRIETIKPNRLKINLSSPELLHAGDPAKIGVEAHWLTGPVAAGLVSRVELSLYENPNPFEGYKSYTFRNPLFTPTATKHDLFTFRLDSLGRCSYTHLLPVTEQATGMMQALLIARVEETGGDESITSRSVRYSPYESYVGIDLKERAFESDSDLSFPVVTLNAKGEPIVRRLSYKIYHLDWSWWWEGTAQDLSRYVQSATAEVVSSGEIVTQDGAGELKFRVEYPDSGKYLIYVEDPISKHATGGVLLVDWPDWRGHSQKGDPTAATMLSFSLDKRSYEVGDQATVYLPKSAQGRVLLSVENGSRVISRHWVRTSAERETAYRLPITSELSPNFYVHATLLQPHAQSLNDLPIRMYGIEGAEVIDRHTILHPIIELPEEVSPGEEFIIRVREEEGKPMSYTLAIVDEGLLDITSFRTPEPWRAMNQREALGVKSWDMYDEVIGAFAGRFSSILSVGGDEALREAVGKEKRFNPVVKFLGPFTLNRGVKSHRITLPMYVGSLRVMLLAAKQGAYGSAEKSLKVTSPLMLLSTMPRKLNCGDRLNMPVNLFAMKPEVKQVQVSLHIEGPLSVVGERMQQISFSEPLERLLNFELQCDAKQCGQAKVVISARGGGYEAQETLYIDVQNPLPDLLRSESSILERGEKQRFDYGHFQDGEAVLTLSTVPSIDFGGAFSYVKSYPHLCTEQLASRAIFLLHARRFLTPEEQQQAEQLLPKLIQALAARQLPNGGFLYWPSLNEPHDWVTSMVGEVLVEARRQGFAISSPCFEGWKEYQKSAARRYRHSSNLQLDLVQAYRLYTLALAGERPTAAMNMLRESKELSRQALLRLALTYAILGREDVAQRLLERWDTTPQVKGHYLTFSSLLRDKAMALESWLYAKDKFRAFALAKELSEEFSMAHASTQEIAFVSLAMSRMAERIPSGASQVAISEGGGVQHVISNLSGVQHLALNPQKGYLEVENRGEGELFLWLQLSRKPSVDAPYASQAKGVELAVKYCDLEGNSKEVAELKQGEEFLVEIEVVKRGDGSPSMALSYIVPSGWEIWNERLVGEPMQNQALYTDIRDERINWYFAMEQGERKSFKVRLRAAYIGQFTLPVALCEDMYDPLCRANTSNGIVRVVR